MKKRKKIKFQHTYKSHELPNEWQGITPKNIRPYRKYVNREKPGFCGTYTAAVLVHYTIKHDRGYELDMDKLITAFKPRIDQNPLYKGSYIWDIVKALQDFFAEDDSYQIKWHLVSESQALGQLKKESPLPLIVGTMKFLGSKYGNHWVLVYGYGYNEDGKLFYRAWDNHGKNQAIIAASQTLPCVWIERK